MTNPAPPPATLTAAQVFGGTSFDTKGNATIRMPATAAIGIAYTAGRWTFEADADWTFWSSYKVAELMLPVFANSSIDIMTAINANGEEILTLGRDPETSQIQNQQGRDFSVLSSVQLALKGKPDPLGDKFVEIVKPEDGKAFLLTTAPLRDSEDRIVGVMVVGSHLDSVLKDLKDQALTDLILLDNENNVISTTFTQKEEGFQSLVDLIGGQDPTDTTQLFDVTLNKRDHLIAYSPFIVREQWVGWLGVIEKREYRKPRESADAHERKGVIDL